MEYTGEDEQFYYFVDEYEGHKIDIAKRKADGLVTLSLKQVAVALGYDSLEHMLEDDTMLDAFSQGLKSGDIFQVETPALKNGGQ